VIFVERLSMYSRNNNVGVTRLTSRLRLPVHHLASVSILLSYRRHPALHSVMAESQYAHVSPDADSFQLKDRSPRRESLSLSSEDSDISYRDNLDDEPFDEKDRRFQDESAMEDGEGYDVEPRRVCPVPMDAMPD